MDDNLPAETPSCSPVPGQYQLEDNCFNPTPLVYNWVDVTESFKEACNTLESGVLVKEQNFTLYEAMSAIEMMDPKMDSWMIGQKVKRKILSFVDSIEQGVIKLDDFTSDELILMMDHCHGCILSWLDGQSLAQTVFTFLYLHEPTEIKSRCLKAFCFGVLKLCDTIMEKIDKARVFEEEDFQLLRYRFKFASELSTTRVIGMMREVEDEYGRLIRSTKSKTQSTDADSDDEINRLLIGYDGVLRRIKFLRLFLQSLTCFGGSKLTDPPAQNISKVFVQMAENLKIMKKTAPLHVDTTKSDDNQSLVPGFEPLLNQRLLPPTFPRYTKLHSISDMFDIYDGIIDRMLLITNGSQGNSFQGILNFVTQFSRSNSCVLTRSLAQIHFTPARLPGNQAVDAIRDSLKAFNAPPCMSTRNNFYLQPKVKLCVETFLSQALMAMVKVYQVYGHNYARQREKLAMILESLTVLQEYGDRCDAEISEMIKRFDPEGEPVNHLAYLGGWSLYHTLKVMIEYVASGFVLKLYSNHELHYIYWYLSEVLLNWLLQTLNRADSQLLYDENMNEQAELRKTRSNKKSKRNKKKNVRDREHAREITVTQAWLALGWGTFKAILGFTMAGKLSCPDMHFDNESIRYEHRFAPFYCVTTPPYLTYKQYRVMTDTTNCQKQPSPEDLYLSSSRHFAAAKSYCESVPDCPDMQKLLLVAKTNLVVTKILSGGPSPLTEKKKINLDFSTHRAFPIIKMTQ